jgi:hypothetical protein
VEVKPAATVVTHKPVAPSRQLPSRSQLVWAGLSVAAIAIAVTVLMRRDSPPATDPVAVTPPAPVPAPPAPPPLPPEPEPPAPSSLALQELPPGAQVSLDGVPIGTVGRDGTLAYSGISAGSHTLEIARSGSPPISVTRDFSAGAIVTVSGKEIVIRPAENRIEFLADADTQVTITQRGRIVQQFKGSTMLSLPDGAYQLTATGAIGVPTTRQLSVSAGMKSVNLRNIAAGMEGFDLTTWSRSEDWYTRRGGSVVLYERRNSNGRFTFTIRTDRTGNPFSSGARLTWVVGYMDSSNYVMLSIDRDAFYRNEAVKGVQAPTVKISHKIPLNTSFVHFSSEISRTQLAHRYSLDNGATWIGLDTWDRPATDRPLLTGRFGFFLPGTEEIFVSNFRFYPPTR